MEIGLHPPKDWRAPSIPQCEAAHTKLDVGRDMWAIQRFTRAYPLKRLRYFENARRRKDKANEKGVIGGD